MKPTDEFYVYILSNPRRDNPPYKWQNKTNPSQVWGLWHGPPRKETPTESPMPQPLTISNLNRFDSSQPSVLMRASTPSDSTNRTRISVKSISTQGQPQSLSSASSLASERTLKLTEIRRRKAELQELTNQTKAQLARLREAAAAQNESPMTTVNQNRNNAPLDKGKERMTGAEMLKERLASGDITKAEVKAIQEGKAAQRKQGSVASRTRSSRSNAGSTVATRRSPVSTTSSDSNLSIFWPSESRANRPRAPPSMASSHGSLHDDSLSTISSLSSFDSSEFRRGPIKDITISKRGRPIVRPDIARWVESQQSLGEAWTPATARKKSKKKEGMKGKFRFSTKPRKPNNKKK